MFLFYCSRVIITTTYGRYHPKTHQTRATCVQFWWQDSRTYFEKGSCSREKGPAAKKTAGKVRAVKGTNVARAKREEQLSEFQSLARPGAMGMVLPKRTEATLRQLEYDFKKLKPGQLRTVHKRLNDSLPFCTKAAPYLAAIHRA